MTTQRTWLWIGGIIAVAAAALVLGMPLAALVLFALVLVCPLAMYFMMHEMGRQQISDPAEMQRRDVDLPPPRRGPTENERQAPHIKYGGRP